MVAAVREVRNRCVELCQASTHCAGLWQHWGGSACKTLLRARGLSRAGTGGDQTQHGAGDGGAQGQVAAGGVSAPQSALRGLGCLPSVGAPLGITPRPHLTWDLVQELVGGAGQDPHPVQLGHQERVLIQDKAALPLRAGGRAAAAQPRQTDRPPEPPAPSRRDQPLAGTGTPTPAAPSCGHQDWSPAGPALPGTGLWWPPAPAAEGEQDPPPGRGRGQGVTGGVGGGEEGAER